MGLSNIVRSGIKLADRLTSDLQPTVTLRRWSGETMEGDDTYVNSTQPALFEQRQTEVRTPSGELRQARGKVTFLRPIPPLGGVTGRTEPIDVNDRIVAPDGSEWGVIVTEGMIDKSTGQPYMSEVWLS